jgi:pimeloyl-ACP methyl ester carboxylesterase
MKIQRWRSWAPALTLALLVPIVVLLAPATVTAEASWLEEGGCVNGWLDDAEILIRVPPPAAWNGQLVVYAHGYVPPQYPLEVDVSLPNSGTTIPDILVPLGFAFATSSYSKNGYAVEQAFAELLDLVGYFENYFVPEGRELEKVFIIGGSEGGLIGTMLLEQTDVFDGGLILCAPLGGAPYQIQYLGDFRVVFDYFFPQVFDFGVIDVPGDAWEDWEKDGERDYVDEITDAIVANPDATEQLCDVTKAARDPWDPVNSAVETAINVLRYSVFATNDIQEVAGGNPYGNRLRFYLGSRHDWALNRGVERVRADWEARSYLRDYYEPSGQLSCPVVVMHTTNDDVVPFRHVLIYQMRALAAGSWGDVTVLPIPRYGHCAFEVPELLGGFALMLWQANGEVPFELWDLLFAVLEFAD